MPYGHFELGLIANSDGDNMNITLYHNGTQLETVADACGEHFIVTGALVDSDHITRLNSMPIKKFCALGGKQKIVILTICGKIYALDNFDSDKQYDLTNCQIKVPNDEFIDDIDCGHHIVALTINGGVYKIDQSSSSGEPAYVVTKIASHVKQLNVKDIELFVNLEVVNFMQITDVFLNYLLVWMDSMV